MKLKIEFEVHVNVSGKNKKLVEETLNGIFTQEGSLLPEAFENSQEEAIEAAISELEEEGITDKNVEEASEIISEISSQLDGADFELKLVK